ncbi:MAG: MaoC family dehydratase N-terminal domain-containing protein [bacterium]|nr:MaoC family dehydratase N-terminal domain-containing protein [bacterium]
MATIRKHRGHFLEDFVPGDVYRHRGGKTVTEGLFTLFTDFSMTTNPLSKNARYARAYGFDGLVVPPGLVMLVVFSQSVEDVSENARANLEYIDMRFGAPVYLGDTLEAETKVLGVKGSSSNPRLGVVHVQTTGRNQDGKVVLTFQRKVQVWKRDPDAKLHDGEVAPDAVDAELVLPAFDRGRGYGDLAHLTNPDSYFEDFTAGDVLEHSRGRVVTTDHIMLTGILDNTSQVHCNQWMVEQEPDRYVGGQLIVFGGIPFNLCLGISSADVGDNSLGDVRYVTGRHTAPIFAGDTVFASTEIRALADYPGRPDLGVMSATLRGHKFVKKNDAVEKVEIFHLEREIALKRRSHYAA